MATPASQTKTAQKTVEKPVKKAALIKKPDESPLQSPSEAMEDLPRNPNIPAAKPQKASKKTTIQMPKDHKEPSNGEKEPKERELKLEATDPEDDKLFARVGNCRFYEQQFPEVDDVVVVEVKRFQKMKTNRKHF